jgi:hypothetical protein
VTEVEERKLWVRGAILRVSSDILGRLASFRSNLSLSSSSVEYSTLLSDSITSPSNANGWISS